MDLAFGPRANGLTIGTSMPDWLYASIRARHCSGVPAMLVASINSSLAIEEDRPIEFDMAQAGES